MLSESKILTYEKTTNDIRVMVTPMFVDDESQPDNDFYLWAYQVRIENLGDESVQLQDRFWEITDSRGAMQEVSGAGVVGDQPTLNPGDAYEYTSMVPLKTSSGFMRGNYTMASEDSGKELAVEIPAFSLDSPYSVKVLN